MCVGRAKKEKILDGWHWQIALRSTRWHWHLRKVEASGGKEAPVSLLLSLNGVGGSDGNVAGNFFLNNYLVFVF